MSVHRQGDLGSARMSVQAMGLRGPSLDFKADRVENRVGLSDREVPCFRDREGDQIWPWWQQGSPCSAYIQDRILTVHWVLMR